jgi:hypothetical protein
VGALVEEPQPVTRHPTYLLDDFLLFHPSGRELGLQATNFAFEEEYSKLKLPPLYPNNLA